MGFCIGIILGHYWDCLVNVLVQLALHCDGIVTILGQYLAVLGIYEHCVGTGLAFYWCCIGIGLG